MKAADGRAWHRSSDAVLEVVNRPFTVIEMRLDKENHGEGKVLLDTKIFIDPKTNDLVLEQYDLQPVRLNQIRLRS
jgi:hypothetical protein